MKLTELMVDSSASESEEEEGHSCAAHILVLEVLQELVHLEVAQAPRTPKWPWGPQGSLCRRDWGHAQAQSSRVDRHITGRSP